MTGTRRLLVTLLLTTASIGSAQETSGFAFGPTAGVFFPDREGTGFTVFRFILLHPEWSIGARVEAPLNRYLGLEASWTRATMEDVWPDGAGVDGMATRPDRPVDTPVDLVGVVLRMRPLGETYTRSWSVGGGIARTRMPDLGLSDVDPVLFLGTGTVRPLREGIGLWRSTDLQIQICDGGSLICEPGEKRVHVSMTLGLRIEP